MKLRINAAVRRGCSTMTICAASAICADSAPGIQDAVASAISRYQRRVRSPQSHEHRQTQFANLLARHLRRGRRECRPDRRRVGMQSVLNFSWQPTKPTGVGLYPVDKRLGSVFECTGADALRDRRDEGSSTRPLLANCGVSAATTLANGGSMSVRLRTSSGTSIAVSSVTPAPQE